jgi:Bacterial CdiA-CT RNAse A domain
VAQAETDRSGYPVDILREEALGGHTFDRHVGKPDQYLKARILQNRANIAGIFGFGEKRAGSFTSLEAANKLVNSTMSSPENVLKIQNFVGNTSVLRLPFQYVFKNFKTPTGYEAYSPETGYQPIMRSTYGVTIRLQRSTSDPRGYYVHSAWPMNED